MNQHNKQDTQNKHDNDSDSRSGQQRQNPRLVFNDPDKFFYDLLMEQNEQQ